ncbi:UpxY family transcription antiterminator [Mucilaginibacter myungsuensis]|uniref:UpxY family transcription antiterminator n=1 Tax=Mucilaginibacter myungsuensis TaxID=649104 RepID=A0A929PW55_9SPHI|nr:UpxY family transcription antiterminator [Mucilaginibacter myungsuensis]MBE9660817.1 UpxY family transcription antiterminator [Mucilaginibacter myungsuensis]MDN3600863.1 UpxY family transcription antiterminator [Mucilaginibacter myungsuensis]
MTAGVDVAATRWYPVYTDARAEKKAYQALVDKGVTAYLPLRKTLKQWADRKKWVEEPLIRSYLFVNIKAGQQADVLMTRGIARFIYFSGKVAAMPDRQIEALKLVLAGDTDVEVTEEELKPGEKVRIKAGPLKDMEAEVVEYRSQKRLALRFEHLGCSVIIHTAVSLIQRV